MKKLEIGGTKNKPSNFYRNFGKALLCLFPIILFMVWYISDSEKIYLFNNWEVKGGTEIVVNNPQEIIAIKDAPYNLTKDNLTAQFTTKEKTSDLENFKSEVSKKFIEELGIFSSLPIHKACLVNKNKVYILGELREDIDGHTGQSLVNQKDGYNFFAERGKKDCKNVIIKKLRDAQIIKAEYTYPFATSISDTENTKFQKGESFSFIIATSSVTASETYIETHLSFWTFLIFYLIFLPAWSLIFFQYEKIIKYLYNQNV